MKSIVIAAATLAAVLGAGAAWAADAKGEVATIDRQTRQIGVVGEGECVCTATTYNVPANVDMGWLSPGVVITITFNMENNVRVVTKIAK